MRQGPTPRGNVVPLTSLSRPASARVNRPNWVARTRNLILLGCIFWALWTYFFVQLPTLKKLEREKSDLSHQLLSLQKEQTDLQKTVKNLGSDEYIERIVRRDYNMIKPGDILYQGSQNP